jgi:phosphatidylserine/phosphatidylglycerophosphate/cardiolipin synthase-like enzyme
VVTESDHILEEEIQDLLRAGIEVHGDDREPLMHHKFVVADQSEVWTGSMNFTVNGAYRNNNNLLRIKSQEIADNYRREFDEMFEENRYGRLSRADTPYPEVELGSGSVSVMFSPDDGVERRILSALRTAEHEIVLMAFSLTSDVIGEVLLEQAERGVEVRGVIERTQASNPGSEYDRLVEAGLDIRLDANPDNMHHKVIVIDGETVLTGSYNFSRAASEENDENMLLIRDRELAGDFLLEFDRLFHQIDPGD